MVADLSGVISFKSNRVSRLARRARKARVRLIGVGEMKAESQAGIGNGQMGMGRPPGRSGVSESRDGPRSTSRPVDPGNGDVECATVVPAAWTARAREWWIEEIIELLRLTPARGGVTAIRATARRWVILGGGSSPRRRWLREAVAIRELLSRGVARLRRGCRRKGGLMMKGWR